LIISFLSMLKADKDALVIFLPLCSPKRNLRVIIPDGEATAIQVVPTGFSGLPPVGPAIPETAME
jgi:hypothetical protein